MGEHLVIDISTLIDILHLEAALLEEPVLQTGNRLMLVHAERGVEIEEVIRAYELQSFVQGNGTSNVGTTAGGTSVLTFYIFPMYVEVFRFVVEAYRPAVTLIVVAFMNG